MKSAHRRATKRSETRRLGGTFPGTLGSSVACCARIRVTRTRAPGRQVPDDRRQAEQKKDARVAHGTNPSKIRYLRKMPHFCNSPCTRRRLRRTVAHLHVTQVPQRDRSEIRTKTGRGVTPSIPRSRFLKKCSLRQGLNVGASRGGPKKGTKIWPIWAGSVSY